MRSNTYLLDKAKAQEGSYGRAVSASFSWTLESALKLSMNISLREVCAVLAAMAGFNGLDGSCRNEING